MVNSFINPVVNPDAKLGVSFLDDTAPVVLLPNCSEAELEVVIRAVYRQVLGNAHVMESERLVVLESQLKRQDISVRGFVCQVAQSELYRSRFFENCSRMRSIELNFKHLLGRAPESYEEMVEHGQYLDLYGFESEIASYIYSDEYLDNFGENIVPYYRGYKTQTGKNMRGFSYMLTLLRGGASSDRDLTAQNRSRLNFSLMSNRPSVIVPIQGATSPRHQSYGQLQVSDVSKILAELFKPKFHPETSIVTPATSVAELALQQKIKEQSQTIATLQQQLAALSSFATIGTAYLSDWQSSTVTTSSSAGASALWQQADTQAAQIVKLQEQIADARRYAAIGESRLNKWRGRVFNG